MVTTFFFLWPNVKCPSIKESANRMPICAALIHQSLGGKLRVEACEPIHWGCLVWNKSGKKKFKWAHYYLSFLRLLSWKEHIIISHNKRSWQRLSLEDSTWFEGFSWCSSSFMTVIIEPLLAVITLGMRIIIHSKKHPNISGDTSLKKKVLIWKSFSNCLKM